MLCTLILNSWIHLRFIGGVDLLLHLLTNIIELPVTKSVVKDSGMGKAIGSIEKHPVCSGTLNETAVRERVEKIKTAWNKSVKALKEKVLIEQSSISSRPRILPNCFRSSCTPFLGSTTSTITKTTDRLHAI